METDGGQRQGRSEQEMARLFFGALFRLGAYAPDWETWYGTRQVEFPNPRRRSVGVHRPLNPRPAR